jgi:hypothetical protein
MGIRRAVRLNDREVGSSAEHGNLLTIPNMAHRANRAPKVVQSDQTSDFATSTMLRNEEVRRAVTKAVRSLVLQVTYKTEITLIVVSLLSLLGTGRWGYFHRRGSGKIKR